MTPLALEMLIWARTRIDFCAFPNISREPQQEIFASFRETGVLDEHYRLTPLGRKVAAAEIERLEAIVEMAREKKLVPRPRSV